MVGLGLDFMQPGVVMIQTRGRRHSDIQCSSPQVSIAVLELVLGESLLWNCLKDWGWLDFLGVVTNLAEQTTRQELFEHEIAGMLETLFVGPLVS